MREELHALRGKDEDAELHDEAEIARAQQLSLQVRSPTFLDRRSPSLTAPLLRSPSLIAPLLRLQPLYAKPPPIWIHPAFAAEFGDAFLAGTGLEGGTLHISLEVVVMTLQVSSQSLALPWPSP